MSASPAFDSLLAARTGKGAARFVRRCEASDAEVEFAAARVARPLPPVYRDFLRECGAGDLDDALRFVSPSALHLADLEGVPWNGFLVFAEDDLGNQLAFGLEERPEPAVYYLCHDPFGMAPLAQTFEGFLEELSSLGFDYGRLVEGLEDFVEVDLPSIAGSESRPWWKFW